MKDILKIYYLNLPFVTAIAMDAILEHMPKLRLRYKEFYKTMLFW